MIGKRPGLCSSSASQAVFERLAEGTVGDIEMATSALGPASANGGNSKLAEENGSGLKSLDAALEVLAYMARRNGPIALSEIGRNCNMPPSKVHRYLASFVHAGLARQEGRSGRYDLGPEAMQLGLAALSRHDFVNRAADGLPELALKTSMTVLLAVWANDGATVVRWERGMTPTVTSMGLGTTLPLLNSATGRVFLAWAPKPTIENARDSELRRAMRNPALLPDTAPNKAGIIELAQKIRERGFASVDGQFIPGLAAAAAPILDWQGQAQAAVTVFGVDPAAVSPGAPAVEALLEFCRTCSVTREIC